MTRHYQPESRATPNCDETSPADAGSGGKSGVEPAVAGEKLGRECSIDLIAFRWASHRKLKGRRGWADLFGGRSFPSKTLSAAKRLREPAPTPLQAQPQPGRGSSRGPDTIKPGTGDSRERPATLPAQTSGVAPGTSGPVGDADGALCWRCGGEPLKHERLVVRRPVCAGCVWELIQAGLRGDLPEGPPKIERYTRPNFTVQSDDEEGES